MACSSKNDPENVKQPYAKGQEISIQCIMEYPDDCNKIGARRIYGTASSTAAGTDVPFTWHFDAKETLLIQDLDASENNTSELQMNLVDKGSGNQANFTGKMPESWEVGHHFIAICRAENDAQEPKSEINKTSKDNNFIIERGEMRFESEEYTDIPEQLVLKAAWSAMQISITIATENKEEIPDDVDLTSSFKLTKLEIYSSDNTLLYRFQPYSLVGKATANSGTGAIFLPFFVVKNGNYDDFIFKAYFKNTNNIYMADDEADVKDCTFEEIVQPGAKSHITKEDDLYVATFQYSTSLTLLPNQYLKSDVATISFKVTIDE